MKLIIDKTHKKADITELDIFKPLYKFAVSLLTFSIVVHLYTGGDFKLFQKQVSVGMPQNSSIQRDIDSNYDDKVNKYELGTIHKLNLYLDEGYESLEFLKYCNNLESLCIYANSDNYHILNTVPEIHSLRYLEIHNENTMNAMCFDYDPFFYLSKLPNLETLDVKVDYFYFPKGSLEKYKNIKNLSIKVFDPNICDLDFNEFTFLESLNIKFIEKPYDVAMYYGKKDFQNLLDANVNLSLQFPDNQTINTFFQVDEEINSVYNSLNINENQSDIEKLDIILCYVLENLTYDPEVAENISDSYEFKMEIYNKFYKNGSLYGALKSNTAICGNYAALVNALANRANLTSMVISDLKAEHAWNMIKIEGDFYYFDATWLDDKIIYDSKTKKYLTSEEAIKIGKGESLKWYMETPGDYSYAHNSNLSEINVVPLEAYNYEYDYSDLEENCNEDIKINVNGKEKYIKMGAIIGVLLAIGGAIDVAKLHNKIKNMDNYEKIENNKKR